MDGSFSAQEGRASAGMVLQRENGSTIFAAYRYIFNCNDALDETEIHALIQGMALAIEHSDMSIIVQSDSTSALATIEGDTLCRSAYGHLAAEIKAFMVDREFLPLKISRDQNKVAHQLALYSRTNACTAVWLNSSLPFYEDLLSRDYNSIIMK
ncbi:hypothetical protein VPH35_065224 [Triticum aestivum]|uniref:RNase H type-1 domain-containing protein n=1 Tax=Triticum turgidum subsp. durum TaxID=4567 RepID=A0A9R0S623_TRITD|nr:unnamed protein product [Triticum turgidum subsp. durum]